MALMAFVGGYNRQGVYGGIGRLQNLQGLETYRIRGFVRGLRPGLPSLYRDGTDTKAAAAI